MPTVWQCANGPSLLQSRDQQFHSVTTGTPLAKSTGKGEHIMSVNSDFAIVQQSSKPSRALNLTIWGVQILTALAFLAAGASKLSGAPAMVEMFEKIGFGQWFRYLTGSLEVLGAVLLVLPRTAAIGGWLLAALMIGAIGTHLVLIGGTPLPAIILFMLAVTVGWNRSNR
jgi:putative oxidoreductase